MFSAFVQSMEIPTCMAVYMWRMENIIYSRRKDPSYVKLFSAIAIFIFV